MAIQTQTLRSAIVFGFIAALTLGTSSPSVAAEGEVQWLTNVEAALQQAADQQRPVLMEFTASWCVYCKRMEKTTFVDASVAEAVNARFIPVKVDADQHKALVKDLGIKGLPAMLIVAPDLKIIERISGFQTAEALMKRIDAVQPAPVVAVTPKAEDISRPTAFHNNETAVADPFANQPAPAPPNPFAPTPQAAPEQPNAFAAEPQAQSEAEAGRASFSMEPSLAEETNPFASPEAPTVESNPLAEPSATASPDVSGRVSLGEFLPSSPEPTLPAAEAVPAQPDPLASQYAFEGSCPVTAIDDRKLTPGQDAYAVEYRQQKIRFSSLEARVAFETNPEKYWPMLDGACPVTLARSGHRVAGDLRHAVLFRKRIWLLANDEAMATFVANPAAIVQDALVQLQQTNAVTR